MNLTAPYLPNVLTGVTRQATTNCLIRGPCGKVSLYPQGGSERGCGMQVYRVHASGGTALIEADSIADAWQTSVTDPAFIGQHITHIVQAVAR